MKSEKKVSESIFGPLNFFNLSYIKGGILGKQQHMYKKVHKNFLMGVTFGTSWGSPKFFSKSHYYGDFFKNGLKSNFLESDPLLVL